MVKEPEELVALQKAIDITEKAFRRVLSFTKPGVSEFEIEAEFIHEFIKNRSGGFAYTPIIASGANACVLHYISNELTCQDGDLVLLDVMLPGITGIEVCREIRKESMVPIVMLTAKGDTHDVVLGLEAGADDYMVKPFNPGELVARIRTRLRSMAPSGATSQTLRIGDLSIDVDGHEVKRGDVCINLTPLEFDLLVALASKPQQVFTREMLLEKVWGYQYKADTRLVNVHVQRLRSKVEFDADNPTIVTTVRGVGYRAGAVI